MNVLSPARNQSVFFSLFLLVVLMFSFFIISDANQAVADILPLSASSGPPPTTPPDASKISIGQSDLDGYATISGVAGAVEADAYVGIVNLSTRSVMTTTANTQGAFSANLFAPPGSWLLIKYGHDFDRFKTMWSIASNQEWDGNSARLTEYPGTIIQADGFNQNGPIQQFNTAGGFFELETTKEWAGWWLSGTLQIPGSSGQQELQIQPGDTLTLTARLRVTVPDWICSETPDYALWASISLDELFDSDGQPIRWNSWFNSYLFTPTDFPIEHEGSGDVTIANGHIDFVDQVCAGTHSFDGFTEATFDIPSDLPPGLYAPKIYIQGSPPTGLVPIAPVWYHDTSFGSLPFLKVGSFSDPMIPFTLLINEPFNGHRGLKAREFEGIYALPTRVVHAPHRVVVPRLDARTGEPIQYNLEPGSYWISGTDRRFPNPPWIPVNLPSGELSIQITRPDGGVDHIGPAPILQSKIQSPTIPDGSELHERTGGLDDVYHLTTLDDVFNYAFPQYGDYVIELSGFFEDIYGNVYPIMGTYDLTVARILDIDPAQLPTTPYVQGNTFSPGLHVFPPVPAEVFVDITHLPYSNPDDAVHASFQGNANRFGYFQPPPGNDFTFDDPGEFRVDITAVYEALDGTLWMGTMSWGNVVEGSTPALEAHGRRGMDYDNSPIDNMPIWFRNQDLPPEKIGVENYFPYFSGDIHWGDQNGAEHGSLGDSIHSIITIKDRTPTGDYYEILRNFYPRTQHEFRRPPSDVSINGLNERIAIGEAPLFITTVSGRDPTRYPDEIDLWGYYYASSQRPDVRVREMVSEDATGTAYWGFNDTYGYQIGEPANGDQPGDIKWEFGGAVFRVISETNPINEYAIYSSLWVLLPDECDAFGCARVTPPFQDATGASFNGGPIMTLLGEDVDMLFLPKCVRPGDILEVGNTVAFCGHVGPPLDSRVEVTITAPSGATYTGIWHANKIGWLYDPTFDFLADEAGPWTVDVSVEHDRPYTGNGVTPTSHNTGTVLGSGGQYSFYVVAPGTPNLSISNPQPGFITWPEEGIAPIYVRGTASRGTSAVHYTIYDKGVVMGQGSVTPDASGVFTVTYDAVALHESFSMLSLTAHEGRWEGLADEVAINLLAVGGEPRANTVTLIGEEVFVRNDGTAPHLIFLPLVLKQ